MSPVVALRLAVGRCASSVALIACTAIGSAAHAERPTWQTLPDQTLLAVRVPAPREFFEALKSRTKLGQVAFEERRLAAVNDVIVEDSKKDFEVVAAQFAELGLSFDDLKSLADGELGYAAVARKSEEGSVRYTGLAWSECGEAAAEKWLAALDKSLAEQSDEKFPIRREDLELAGVAVRHLIAPHLNTDEGELKIDVNNADGKLGGALEINGPEKKDDRPTIVTGCAHLLVCRFESKLLALHTLPETSPGDEPTSDQLTALETETGEFARAVMSQWLEAQSVAGDGIVGRWLETPGLVEALPEGVPAVEAIADLQGLLALIDGPEAAEQRKLLEALGFGDLGPIAHRTTLDGTTLRSGTFVSAPQPRRGALAVLDQRSLPLQVADWIAADVLSYQHLSVDLGLAYAQIADIVRKNSPQGEKTLAALEAQVEEFLQIDLGSLLSSLGSKHTIVSFVPEKLDDGSDAVSQNAMAFVWRVTDAALWTRLMQMAAVIAGQEIKQEQGFSGLRHDTKDFGGGWFLGDGTMVLAVGKGVTEKTLAMLRNPPPRSESLAGGSQARRAAELLSPQPAVTFELTNGSTVLYYVNQAAEAALSDAEEGALKRLKEVWPTDEELKNVVGVSAAATYVNGHGISHQSVSDLPAP